MNAHVGELSALVEDLVSTGFSDDRLGYWGMSMGTGIGLRFVASEPRIKAAVLGLAGLGAGMGGTEFETAARSLGVPILFLLQWDDELIARDAGLALFDAIGSTDKTLHVNPGDMSRCRSSRTTRPSRSSSGISVPADSPGWVGTRRTIPLSVPDHPLSASRTPTNGVRQGHPFSGGAAT